MEERSDFDGVEIGDSTIAGKGIFAKKKYSPSNVVFVWDTSNEVPEDKIGDLDEEEHFLTRHNGRWFIMPAPMRFMNHSCEPNTQSIGGKDMAIKEIKIGEEITTDYRSHMRIGERMECNCSTSSCKGYIIGIAP